MTTRTSEDAGAELVGGVLLDPARLQPPAITTVTAIAAAVLIDNSHQVPPR